MDDLLIVGAGWAGLSAAAFAVTLQPTAKIRVIGQGIGSPIVTPGWVSVWESAPQGLLAALRTLIATYPDHPYALAGAESLPAALDLFAKITAEIGLFYRATEPLTNQRTITPLGAAQHPAMLPIGYQGANRAGDSPLFVGLTGWRDYYPALSGPRHISIQPPVGDRPWDLTPPDYARLFDRAEFREKVIGLVRPHLSGASSVGFPAVLGLEHPADVINHLESSFKMPVFEMPTLPPSVPGTRLFNGLRRYLLDRGVRLQVGHPVGRGIVENGAVKGVEVLAAGKPQPFRTRAVLLATGNLYGGGLFSDDRGRVWEPLFGLPVQHVTDRNQWFAESMLAVGGHPAHYFGVRADSLLRPLNADGQPAAQNLYVAGHILAHPHGPNVPDPLETAEGVALATAYRVVRNVLG